MTATPSLAAANSHQNHDRSADRRPYDGSAAEPVRPADLLRRTLRRQATAVTVVTVPGPAGFTATSFTSASLEPALVSFYLSSTASTAATVRAADRFAVHLLGSEQEELARGFARSGVDRFAGVAWTPSTGGLPLLSGVPAWLTARTVHVHDVGDHFLVVGEVEDAGGPGAEAPLVHHDGAFGTFRTDPPRG
ncbi:NADH-FMN oxidoreductase RutF, flavin reductase (DIM6/NTAB) family [Actinacidiphila alni]|uniref:NADH-FMN oxidoreductase RutF, flavin reductase (DIM6/NTAB) family n=1 Tax=Actinacidiphila alni TaxID=380248 RepID=A0A1I2BWC4_9ACTN|nr:flavin reductase family protein [Actinacidiphila alni]SFE60304.1 NADH-FMN oxidoreductase RutF, flavin reductase (DIM6/NTAB) family [Actinacidiphila alni]